MNSVRLFFLLIGVCAATQASACTNSRSAGVEEASAAARTVQQGSAETMQAPSEDCVTGLPFARGRSFCCLDDYLAHLETQGAIDLPWWRQVRPGVYEHVVRMPAAAPEIATREQLMTRFGFRR